MNENPDPTSRNIPLPIQREVRQRCGFGCVICGSPLYEYDHLVGWAKTKVHVAEEIVLRCNLHHREKTNNLLPIQAVIEENNNPFNFHSGESAKHKLHFSGEFCEIIMGSMRFAAKDKGYGSLCIPISIDGEAMLGFIMADGHLLLNLVWFDEFNNKILQIKNNELFYSASPWDIEWVGRNLTVREAARKMLIVLEFQPPNRVIVKKGVLRRNGIEISIGEKGIIVNGEDYESSISGIMIYGAQIGLALGPHPNSMLSAAFSLGQISRYRKF